MLTEETPKEADSGHQGQAMGFLTDGNVLFVGDGDFSFSVAVSKHPSFQAHKTTTSSLESEASISVHAQASQNMAILKKTGVSVFLETDARELHTHEKISLKTYDRVIFNFPLADRHNIKKNRALLADFFLSCSHILSSKGQVMVTLCKGQGGTPADQPIRSWHDSWQIVAMATNAGFLLQSVVPFDSSLFPEYHSVGFRFQDKSFNTSGALTHIFEMAELVKGTDSGVRGTFLCDDCNYSCSRYVASKMGRDPLTEPNNPMAMLKDQLVKNINSSPALRNISHVHNTHPILPGFRSLAYIIKDNEEDVDMQDNISEREEKSEKERKNRETVEKSKSSPFAHGIDSHADRAKGKIVTNDFKIHREFYLPIDNEDVYVLIKTAKHRSCCGSERESPEREVHEVAATGVDPCKARGLNTDLKENDWTNDLDFAANTSSPVFHHRVSLLEHLPQMCDELITFSSECSFPDECGTCVNTSKNLDLTTNDVKQEHQIKVSNLSCAENTACDKQNSHDRGSFMPSGNGPISCFIMSGQCMLPGPIGQDFIPATQELMLVSQITGFQTIERTCPTKQHSVSHSGRKEKETISSDVMNIHDKISMQVTSTLRFPGCLPDAHDCDNHLSLQSCDSPALRIQGITKTVITEEILFHHKASDSSKVAEPSSLPIGHILHVQKGDNRFHVTLLNITDFTCNLWSIEDKRLLWCTHEKFLTQFQRDSSSPGFTKFKSLCLFPMKFAHDISFWESDSATFNFTLFCDVIRNVANDLVVQISLIDSYVDVITKQRSRCYRLHFESRFQALPYLTSWKLQSRIRMEVSKTLGVTLR